MVKHITFLKVSGKMDCTIEYNYFLHILGPVKQIVRHYFFTFLTFESSEIV